MTRLLLSIGRRPRVRRWAIAELARRPGLFCDLLGIASDTRAPARSWFGGALRPLAPVLAGLASVL